jgi:hypothetical protein
MHWFSDAEIAKVDLSTWEAVKAAVDFGWKVCIREQDVHLFRCMDGEIRMIKASGMISSLFGESDFVNQFRSDIFIGSWTGWDNDRQPNHVERMD